MRTLLLSAALALGAVAPALAQDAETTQLLQDEAALNTRCRGGSGDDTETWQACGARDYVGYLLFQRGWCFGKEDQGGAEMDWHQCTTGSLDFPKPEFSR